MVRATWKVQLKGSKTARVCCWFWCEWNNQSAKPSSVHRYGHALRREDAHVLRRAMEFDVECQGKKGSQKRAQRRHFVKESMNVGLSRFALSIIGLSRFALSMVGLCRFDLSRVSLCMVGLSRVDLSRADAL